MSSEDRYQIEPQKMTNIRFDGTIPDNEDTLREKLIAVAENDIDSDILKHYAPTLESLIKEYTESAVREARIDEQEHTVADSDGSVYYSNGETLDDDIKQVDRIASLTQDKEQ